MKRRVRPNPYFYRITEPKRTRMNSHEALNEPILQELEFVCIHYKIIQQV